MVDSQLYSVKDAVLDSNWHEVVFCRLRAERCCLVLKFPNAKDSRSGNSRVSYTQESLLESRIKEANEVSRPCCIAPTFVGDA